MSELLDQWTERMTRLERAENLRNLLEMTEDLIDALPSREQRNRFRQGGEGSSDRPGFQFLRQGVEGMIYELEQVR